MVEGGWVPACARTTAGGRWGWIPAPRLHGVRLFAGIAEGVRVGWDWGVRLHMGLDSLRFLGPPLAKGADMDELDGGWKKMFQEIEAG